MGLGFRFECIDCRDIGHGQADIVELTRVQPAERIDRPDGFAPIAEPFDSPVQQGGFVLDHIAQRDADLAEQVIIRDEDVDQLYNALFRELLTHMMEDPRNITPCMHLHFVAKNIERMGDHVTNIAEQVVYLVTGEMPDDARVKRDKTAFIAESDT